MLLTHAPSTRYSVHSFHRDCQWHDRSAMTCPPLHALLPPRCTYFPSPAFQSHSLITMHQVVELTTRQVHSPSTRLLQNQHSGLSALCSLLVRKMQFSFQHYGTTRPTYRRTDRSTDVKRSSDAPVHHGFEDHPPRWPGKNGKERTPDPESDRSMNLTTEDKKKGQKARRSRDPQHVAARERGCASRPYPFTISLPSFLVTASPAPLSVVNSRSDITNPATATFFSTSKQRHVVIR